MLSSVLNTIPADVAEAIEVFRQSGFDIWLVGGAVRDALLGRIPEDWDLATDASTETIMRLFPKVIPLGIRYGTLQIVTGKRTIQVTSYKKSGVPGILEDLARRDFTVNAMAFSKHSKRLLDPHGGRRDLERKVLKAVGDAGQRFREDPLRTLRAARFASIYSFKVDTATLRALKIESKGLKNVAQERIRDEMFKLLLGEHIEEAFEIMRTGGILRSVLPELPGHCCDDRLDEGSRDLYRHTLRTMRFCPKRLAVRLAALIHGVHQISLRNRMMDNGPHSARSETCTPVAWKILNRWRVSNDLMSRVIKLVCHYIPRGARPSGRKELRRLLVAVGPALWDDLLDLAVADCRAEGCSSEELEQVALIREQAEAELAAGLPLSVKDLAIKGEDVIETLGVEQGPYVGEILQKLFRAAVSDPSWNDRARLLELLRNMADQSPA